MTTRAINLAVRNRDLRLKAGMFADAEAGQERVGLPVGGALPLEKSP